MLPVVDGVPICSAVKVKASHPVLLNDLSAGQEIVGASGAVTITRCVQDAVRPGSPLMNSVAVQVMMVVPTGYGSVKSGENAGGSPTS